LVIFYDVVEGTAPRDPYEDVFPGGNKLYKRKSNGKKVSGHEERLKVNYKLYVASNL